MQTNHKIIFANSNNMSDIDSESIDLVVTSPPYPMIQMWDKMFIKQNSDIEKALNQNNGALAFELMHQELDKVWSELWRVLNDGGIACINIGNATRTLNSNFVLYPNHSRIISYMLKTGFTCLPEILWRKQTNAPNKFMGSGMMPVGAYVTLEHEFILIFRKGRKKEFKTYDEKQKRRESALFWEERNLWYSDIWMDLKGTSQYLFDNKIRSKNASFPVELPYRLINMFSVKGNIVLDPFAGLGTTMFAAAGAYRNSIGYELESEFKDIIVSKFDNIIPFANKRIQKRINNHINFIENRIKEKGPCKYKNNKYGFDVVTKQEQELYFNKLIGYTIDNDNYSQVVKVQATYS